MEDQVAARRSVTPGPVLASAVKYRLRTVTFRVSEPGELTATPEAAERVLRAIFADLDGDREHMVVLALNARNRIVGFKEVASGTETTCSISPTSIFRTALALGGVAIILAHNHPSGDPDPSPDDRATTQRCVEAGKNLGIDVRDHIVLGASSSWLSFRRRGWIY